MAYLMAPLIRYAIRESMVPSFLPRALATKVLLVGKAINFIRLCCGDADWSLRLSAPLPVPPRAPTKAAAAAAARGGETPGTALGGAALGTALSVETPRGAPLPTATSATSASTANHGERPLTAGSAVAGAVAAGAGAESSLMAETEAAEAGAASAAALACMEYGREAALSAVVSRAAALANARLLELLWGRYELRAHVTNLQQFLLLGKGDFAQTLMEHLAPSLSKPAQQLHRHHLVSLVEAAVRASHSSPTEAEPTLLLRHLDVSLNKGPKATGWDAFALDYRVGAPCDTIFSTSALASYRRLFTFLWQLKRVEHSLTAVWRKHCTASRLLSTLHRDPTIHGCYVLRNEMVHLIYNLQYYLMFEVIEMASDCH
jgi:hypothetical protein